METLTNERARKRTEKKNKMNECKEETTVKTTTENERKKKKKWNMQKKGYKCEILELPRFHGSLFATCIALGVRVKHHWSDICDLDVEEPIMNGNNDVRVTSHLQLMRKQKSVKNTTFTICLLLKIFTVTLRSRFFISICKWVSECVCVCSNMNICLCVCICLFVFYVEPNTSSFSILSP